MNLVDSEFRKTSMRANAVENRRLQMMVGTYDRAKRTAAIDMRKAQSGYRNRLHLLRGRQKELLLSRSHSPGDANLGEMVFHQLQLRHRPSTHGVTPRSDRGHSHTHTSPSGQPDRRHSLPQIEKGSSSRQKSAIFLQTPSSDSSRLSSPQREAPHSPSANQRHLTSLSLDGHVTGTNGLISKEPHNIRYKSAGSSSAQPIIVLSPHDESFNESNRPRTTTGSNSSKQGQFPITSLERSRTTISPIQEVAEPTKERSRRRSLRNESSPEREGKSPVRPVSKAKSKKGLKDGNSEKLKPVQSLSPREDEDTLDHYHAEEEMGKLSHRQRSKLDLRPSTVWARLHETRSPSGRSWLRSGSKGSNPLAGMTGHLGEPWMQVRYFDEDEIEERGLFYKVLLQDRLVREHTRFQSICTKVHEFCGDSEDEEWEREKDGGWRRKSEIALEQRDF